MTYALVTGASKGLGKEIALQLATRKYNLLLVARSGDLLDKLKAEITSKYKVEVQCKAIDLTEANADQQIHSWITENNFNVDVLVNNAGYGLWGGFETLSLAEQMNMLELNIDFPVKITYRLLPLLEKNKRSCILNVASLAAYQSVPYLAAYAASKSFIVSFSRALSLELKDKGVVVTCLSPGGIETSFMDRARMNGKRLRDASARFSDPPAAVAKYGVDKMFNGKVEVVPGFVNQLTYAATMLVPKFISEAIANRLYKPQDF
jgi:short-subunit dehydrogenase